MEEKKNKKKIIAIGAIILGVIIAILLFLTCCVGTKEYTVKFDTNGGSKIQDVVVKENDTVKKPTDPTKKGYIFGGWYYKGKLFNFSTKITKDITLKAKWSKEGESIILNVNSLTLLIDENGEIKVTSLPKGVKLEDLVWSSSDKSIVTVDKNGKLKALKEGNVIITVKTKDGKHKAECQIKVTKKAKEVESLTINGVSTLNIGESSKLSVTIKPTDATSADITWSSSDSSIVSIDQSGRITAHKAGTVTITVKSKNGKTATKTITVKAKQNSSSQSSSNKPSTSTSKPTTPKEVAVNSISVTGPTTVMEGNRITLRATINPSNASNKSVTWSSNNPSIASVDNYGNVTGITPGTVVITVKSANGKTASITITVTEKPASYVVYFTKLTQDVTGGVMQYSFRVTKNGVGFTDYQGFYYNGEPVVNGSGTVSSKLIDTGINSVTITLTGGKTVTATVQYN